MIRFTLSQLAAIAHGERQGSDIAIDEVTSDTRKVTAGADGRRASWGSLSANARFCGQRGLFPQPMGGDDA